MTLSIKQDKVESIIDHFYRLCFISSIWEKENPKKITSAWDGFIYNQHSDDKFEHWWHHNQQNTI